MFTEKTLVRFYASIGANSNNTKEKIMSLADLGFYDEELADMGHDEIMDALEEARLDWVNEVVNSGAEFIND